VSVPTGFGNYQPGVTDNDPHFGSGDDVPQAQCPKCKMWHDDFDGFGVLDCVCGYCTHASATDGQCDVCGERVDDSATPTP
jgi:hypothetical protein